MRNRSRSLAAVLWQAAAVLLGVLAVPNLGSTAALAGEVPTDEAGFTAYMAKAFSQSLPGWKVTVKGPLVLDLEPPKGEGHDARLNTPYSLCQRNPTVCDEAVRMHVAQMSATYKQGEVAPTRAALRAVIRQAAYVDLMRRGYASKGFGEPVAEPLIAGLWTVCAEDLPQAIQFMHPRDLKALQLSRDQAIALCKANTAKDLRPLADVLEELPPQKIGVITDGPYSSSWLLRPEDWGPYATAHKGKLIVAVPATDVVLYTFRTDKKTMQHMRAAIDRVGAAVPRPLSPEVFRWTKKGWKVVPP